MNAQWRYLTLVILLAILPVATAAAQSDDLVREGVRLHDAGDYQGAIESFEEALELDPASAVAYYELANTYFTVGDYKACIETAQAGLERASELEGGFYALAGSCYSSLEKPRKALRQFRKGLETSPESTMLNFNIGVTLAGQGEIEAAIGHFETAAASRPGYASPYYFLGDLHRQVGRPLRGMLYFARFVSLEPNTERTVQAARAAFGLFFWGIEARSETEVELNVSMEAQDDPFGTLEVARTIAAVSIYVDDPEETGADEPAEDDPETEATRKVDAFVTFLQIALEMGSEPELEETAGWQLAMAPLLEIHAEGGSEALGYLMASRAGIAGGQSWIESHTSEIDELSGLLNRIAEGGTP